MSLGPTRGRGSTPVSADKPASQGRLRVRFLPRRRSRDEASGAWYPRWYWPTFAFPGTLWMVLLFLLPFYVVVSIAFGTVDPVFQSPLPVYEPWFWTKKYLLEEWQFFIGEFRVVAVRTIVFVFLAPYICLVIAVTLA